MGYLKETRQLTPEWQMKLEQALSQGYQRLLTFEVSGGGFDWYGKAPANTVLTAYGVLEFVDMAKVHPVDSAVIDRAVRLLLSRQNSDGSWSGEKRWSGSDPVATTAYVAWALRAAGRPNARAVAYLQSRWEKLEDPYALALIANAHPDPRILARLEGMATREQGAARWTMPGQGLFYSWGKSGGVETTALATMALRDSPVADGGLSAIARDKDATGAWGSTQATILALKALLEAGKSKPPAKGVALRLRVNGREVGEGFRPIDGTNFDVAQAVDVTALTGPGVNQVEIDADGDLRASVQVTGRYYLPWDRVPPETQPPLEIEVRYDRTEMARNEPLKARARMAYHGEGTFMVIVDLGIPPGFDVDREPFEEMVREKTIDKYTLAGRQIALYFGRVAKGRQFEFEYTLRPRFPLRATVPVSSVYEYYTPEQRGSSRPSRLSVR